MTGYLVDEGGERTHAVVPVEEYERLKKAAENLETVRGYADEITAVINREIFTEEAGEDATGDSTFELGSANHDPAGRLDGNEGAAAETARERGWQG